MIVLDDYIVEQRERIRYGRKETNTSKKFRCYCISCKKDRGYQAKSRYNKKPMCLKCVTNTKDHRQKLKKNHWSKTGRYSPPKLSPEQKKESDDRNRKWEKNYQKVYYQRYKKQIHERRKQNMTLNTRISSNVRSRLYQCLKRKSSFKLLGCSLEELKKHLESQFTEGMSWDNYGRDGWHIDHIKPLASFDLTKNDDISKACHYTNLQPLWAEDNLRKNRLYPISQQD